MNNSIRYKHERTENNVISCKVVNSISEEKIKNYIKPSVGPDNNVWHKGKSNPLSSKGN